MNGLRLKAAIVCLTQVWLPVISSFLSHKVCISYPNLANRIAVSLYIPGINLNIFCMVPQRYILCRDGDRDPETG